MTGWACDSSVAVAALDGTHVFHEPWRAAVLRRHPDLAGHAAFETYAVLTRLPLPLRLSPRQVSAVLAQAFPGSCALTPDETGHLLGRLGDLGLAGGSVFDALVAEAARCRDRTLLTRDRRASRTYDLIGVRVEFVES